MKDSEARTLRQGLIVGAVLLAFALLAVARLNPFCLLEPDTADYLFTSRALATLDGYREIDHPDAPLHTFRPPGLSLLLAPLALVRPYDVVAAKLIVAAAALAMLVLVWSLTRRLAGNRAAVIVLALVATSPYTLLHATEAITEAPFVALSLGLLLLAMRSHGPPDARELVLGSVLLTALPFLRTVGAALVAAFVVWALAARQRRRWLVAPMVSVAALLGWSAWSARADGPTYFDSIAADLERSGTTGFAAKALGSAWNYVAQLVEVLLPGVGRGQPLYERILLEPAADLGGLWGLALPLTLALTALALVGMLRRRGQEGLLAGSYFLVFVAGLAVYPPKHERLLWPLVPLIWIYVPVGFGGLRPLLARGGRHVRAIATAFAIVLATSLAVWQAATCGAMAWANLSWLRGGDGFYAEGVPPFYYCDWQAAGRWIRDNTPPHAIVLTRHSDVGFTARRYQDSARFEELSPGQWRKRVARLRARYLVVPRSMFGQLFHWPALSGDPVYDLEPVYDARGVVVLEVRPNRSGTVSVHRDDPFGFLDACRASVQRHPERVDLERRLAELLSEHGRKEEAVELLEDLVERRVGDAGVHKTLGTILLELDRPRDALDVFEQAARLPGAEQLARSIERGARRARSRLERPARSSAQEAGDLIRTAQWEMEILRFGQALEAISRAVELAPGDRSAGFVLAEVLQRLGRDEEARRAFELAAAAGHSGAAPKLAMLDLADRVEREAGGDPRSVAVLAEMYVQDGVPGKALGLLERAVVGDGGSIRERAMLADLYLYYGLAEAAEPLYRDVLREAPGEPHAKRGLELARRLLREPAF